MKILKIERCGEQDCQFFKYIREGNEENINFLGLCLYEKRYITEFDQSVHKNETWFESEVVFVPGTFPDWCPLEDV